MAGEAWQKRIDEMMRALCWYDNESGTQPVKKRKGMATEWFEATMDEVTSKGTTEFDAIRNLWQKVGCPDS